VNEKSAIWKPLSDQLENLQMRGLAKSSRDENYIVTANALGFVYHTKDHGKTWEKVTDQNFQYVRRILMEEGIRKRLVNGKVVTVNVTTLWVAGCTGLYRISLFDHQFQETRQLWPQNNAVPNANSAYCSDPSRDVLDVVKQPSNSDVLFIGVRTSGVWETTDGGENWPRSSWADWAILGDNESGTQSQMIKLAINDSRVVAKMGRNVIKADLSDASLVWASTTMPEWGRDKYDNLLAGGSDIGYRGNYSDKMGEWTNAIAIHPTDPEIIVAGQQFLFLYDGERGWGSKIKYKHEDVQSLVFSPDGKWLYVANDGGVFRYLTSDLRTASPTDLNKGLVTIQFYRVGINGPVVVGNADHQGIRGIKDINASKPVWEPDLLGNSVYGNTSLENDFVFADPHIKNRFYISFQDLNLLRLRFPLSGSPGFEFKPFEPANSPVQPYTRLDTNRKVNNQLNYPVGTVAFDPRGPTGDKYIILTAAHVTPNATFSIMMTDKGNAIPPEWTLSYGPVSTPIVSIAFSTTEARKVYALDEAGSVIVKDDIDDALAPWHTVSSFTVEPGDFARQITVDIKTPGKLYAMTHRKFLVWDSSNPNPTWTPLGQSSLQNTGKFNCLASHPTKSNILFLATDTGVFESTDGGFTWRSIDGVLPNAPVMQVITDGGYLYAVTFGRGLWRVRLPK